MKLHWQSFLLGALIVACVGASTVEVPAIANSLVKISGTLERIARSLEIIAGQHKI
jgi:hypothetical protein